MNLRTMLGILVFSCVAPSMVSAQSLGVCVPRDDNQNGIPDWMESLEKDSATS